jgi:hypothetical protein
MFAFRQNAAAEEADRKSQIYRPTTPISHIPLALPQRDHNHNSW